MAYGLKEQRLRLLMRVNRQRDRSMTHAHDDRVGKFWASVMVPVHILQQN